MWTGYDDKVAKDICYNCGSPSSRKTYAYFRSALHYNRDKVWCEIFDNRAMYFAIRCREHVRLIEIAVHKDAQGQGVGRKVLFRLLSAMKRAGLYKLTFRTPIDEEAPNFWLHMGAQITGLKDQDYEMELNIKQD